MKARLPQTLAATLGAIAAVHYPWMAPIAAGAAFPIGKLIEARLRKAHAIAIEEISRGRFESIRNNDPEGFVALAYRYQQAAIEGAAEDNLRLLALLVQGVPDMPSITANDFLHYASVIGSLSRDELILFGAILRAENNLEKSPEADTSASGWPTREAVINELVPQVMAAEDDVAGAFAALSRTGFVVTSSGWGAGEWRTTSAGRRIEALSKISSHPMTNNHR